MFTRLFGRVVKPSLLALGLGLVMFTNVLAQDGATGMVAVTNDAIVSINALYVILAAFLIFFMQAGFALVETGFTRAKNVAHTMMMVLMCLPIATLGYWLVGFGLQFGGINHVYPEINGMSAWSYAPISLGDWGTQLSNVFAIGDHGIIGTSGFMLSGLGNNFGIMAFFFFQLCFMAACAAIPTGAMAERVRYSGFALTTILISVVLYPLIGNWGWGGGWLANLGRTMGFGNGMVDYAGSAVIHLTGGAVALAGAVALGPRIGKYNRDGSANTIAGHNLPMGILGTFILFLGWFAFNSGSALGFTSGFRNLAINAIVSTLLSGAAGGVAAMLYMWFINPLRKPDPMMTVNGLLAGTVAITAPCAFVETPAAIVIGLVAGILCCVATAALDKAHIDDPVGAVPVHLVNGAWGTLAVGIFASGKADTYLWNGVAQPVSGLFYGNAMQFIAQLLSVAVIFIVAYGISITFFKVLNGMKLLRVSAKDELAGLDLPEMGIEGYPPDYEPALELIREAAAAD